MNRLEEIRAREQAATPGPWEQYRPSREYVHNPETNFNICMTRRSYDAKFIAHAREDIPYLLSENDRLTAENERLTAEKDMCEKQAIRYQNEWILRGQEIDRLTAELEKYRAADNPPIGPTHHHISEPENCDECRKQFIKHDLIRFCTNCKHYKGKKDGALK